MSGSIKIFGRAKEGLLNSSHNRFIFYFYICFNISTSVFHRAAVCAQLICFILDAIFILIKKYKDKNAQMSCMLLMFQSNMSVNEFHISGRSDTDGTGFLNKSTPQRVGR